MKTRILAIAVVEWSLSGLRNLRAGAAASQAQIDWAHFGTRKVSGGERRLYAFVLVLSYSRSIFLRLGSQGDGQDRPAVHRSLLIVVE